jgi:hypothetical protein
LRHLFGRNTRDTKKPVYQDLYPYFKGLLEMLLEIIEEEFVVLFPTNIPCSRAYQLVASSLLDRDPYTFDVPNAEATYMLD